VSQNCLILFEFTDSLCFPERELEREREVVLELREILSSALETVYQVQKQHDMFRQEMETRLDSVIAVKRSLEADISRSAVDRLMLERRLDETQAALEAKMDELRVM